MKSTGIVRRVDELGRIVIPIELRRNLDISERDALEIFIEEERIILQKYEPSNQCIVTGKICNSNMSLLNGKVYLSKDGLELLLKEIEEKKA